MIASCAECGFDPDQLAPGGEADALRVLAGRFRAAMGTAASASESDGQSPSAAASAGGARRWTAREYLGHVRDMFVLFEGRIHQLTETDDPVLQVLDHDRAVAGDGYRYADVTVLLTDLEGSAESFIALLGRLGDADWERVGTRAGDPRTVREIAQRAVHECRHHLGDIEISS